MKYKSKNIFITGGAGFIGSHVVKKLVKEGHKVTVYDSFIVYTKPNSEIKSLDYNERLKDVFNEINLVRGDTLNKDFLRRTLNDLKPDVIIHMAAMPLAALALEQTEEAFNSILTSTQNILEIMRDFKHNCRITYISSSMVYGDFLTNPVNELHDKSPKDIYGAFKLAGEYIVSGYAKNYQLDTVILRPSAVYGPLDANNRVIRKFINNAINELPITIDGDGGLKMDFTYVEDAADAIILASLSKKTRNKTYNITRGASSSLKELVEVLKKSFPKLEILFRPVPNHIPSRGTLDISEAKKDFNFSPKISLEIGVNKYINHLRNYEF